MEWRIWNNVENRLWDGSRNTMLVNDGYQALQNQGSTTETLAKAFVLRESLNIAVRTIMQVQSKSKSA
jgi:hypothetical protein